MAAPQIWTKNSIFWHNDSLGKDTTDPRLPRLSDNLKKKFDGLVFMSKNNVIRLRYFTSLTKFTGVNQIN